MFANEKGKSTGNVGVNVQAAPIKSIAPASLLAAISEYRFDTKRPLEERVAHFLVWAAKRFPMQPIQWDYITKAVMGIAKKPRLVDEQVLLIRRKSGKIRVILRETYNRGLWHEHDQGVRATVGSEDVADTSFNKKAKAYGSAKKALIKERSLIKLGEIKSENKRNWIRGADTTLELLKTEDRIMALLDFEAGLDAKKDSAKK